MTGSNVFVARGSGATTNAVGQFDANTGATINAGFISYQVSTSGPRGLARDALNHMFVANYFANTVGEYDATTGALPSTPLSSPAKDRRGPGILRLTA